MRPARLLATVAAASLALGATTAVAEPLTSARQQAYTDAATEFGVPTSVLLGVSYMESRWDTNAGTPSTAAGYGPMHLTDVTTANAGGSEFDEAGTDARGDDARPMAAQRGTPTQVTPVPQLQTVDTAAALTGVDKTTLRADATQNIRGGAALLAKFQKDLGITSDNPADWYGAVARYSGSDDASTASSFADDVFSTIAQGMDRVTDDGQHVTLAPTAVQPNTAQLAKLGLRGNAPGAECPAHLGCDWVPAGYGKFGNTYGNHDLGDRPASQKIDYIIIHDTEGQWDGVVSSIQQPTNPASWQYTVRSSDGHVDQHIQAKDVAWQAGNWYINAKSIGIEHEGFAAAQGKWYTEALYRSSSRLVRYLAAKYQVRLDRQHILGHDNVPGITPALIQGMHWDPGPYWDWTHYFDLLGAPIHPTGTSFTGMVTIRPDYDTNQPAFTGCTTAGQPCPLHGSTSVILHTEPREDAPLLQDIGLHPDGGPTTMGVSDHGSRVETGQQYAVAGQSGDWTAIWYLGQKGWFHNPRHSVGLGALGLVVTPKPGKASIPVYGRAYPEASAYPANVPVQSIVPLPYTFAAGQRYVLGGTAAAEYYYAVTFDTASHTVVKGTTKYFEIQFGHRVMYVNAADVNIWPSFL